MATHKIDQLFNRKTLGHEVQPSSDAWNLLSSQLDGKEKNKAVPYFKIAAAVLLLLVSSILTFRYYDASFAENSGEVIAADHPTAPVINNLVWDIPELQKNAIKRVPKKDLQQNYTASTNSSEIDSFERIEYEVLSVEKISTVAIQIETSKQKMNIMNPFKIDKEREPKISIKYIASQEVSGEEEASPFKKIFNYATSNSPVEIFSDIRSAKNNLISKTLD